MKEGLCQVKWGLGFSFLAIFFGIFIGIAFGAAEESMKQGLKDRGNAVLKETYKGDKEKLNSVVRGGLLYYKRAHLHAGAMGATALGVCLLMAFLSAFPKGRCIASLCTGLGAFLYSFFWFLAGYIAPAMGSTGVAKESLSWLAIPGSGIYAIGIFMAFLLAMKELFAKEKSASS